MKNKPFFLVKTLGCKVNQLESEAIIDAFFQAGFEQRAEKIPGIIVINTCTVTSKADQKARRVIRKVLRDYPDSKVIVTGCYAQLNEEDLLKLETDGKQRLSVVKKDNILDLPQLLINPEPTTPNPQSPNSEPKVRRLPTPN